MRKYVTANKTNIQGWGECDHSGFTVNYRDLKPQMAYNSQGLYWTGRLVYKDFLDKPNEQNLAYVPKVEPKPIKNPRPNKNLTGNI